jgi:hypothetical protein
MPSCRWLLYCAKRGKRRYFGICDDLGWKERCKDGWPWLGPLGPETGEPDILDVLDDLYEALWRELECTLDALREDGCYDHARGACFAFEVFFGPVKVEIKKLQAMRPALGSRRTDELPYRVLCHVRNLCYKCLGRWSKFHWKSCPGVLSVNPAPAAAPAAPKPEPKGSTKRRPCRRLPRYKKRVPKPKAKAKAKAAPRQRSLAAKATRAKAAKRRRRDAKTAAKLVLKAGRERAKKSARVQCAA